MTNFLVNGPKYDRLISLTTPNMNIFVWGTCKYDYFAPSKRILRRVLKPNQFNASIVPDSTLTQIFTVIPVELT